MDGIEPDPCELGTRVHWEQTYRKEIVNFEEHGDPGDVWYGEDCVERITHWICGSGIPKDAPIVDLGCGNGYTLSELAEQGFTNLLGVDYCPEAIMLARKFVNRDFPDVKFQVFDITKDNIKDLGTKFGLVHDKGTYDTICLNPENSKGNRQMYLKQILDMLQDDGMFLITSCNWTDDELIKHFSEKLKLKCVIPTPQFKFGNKIGSVVSSVVFVKK